ncbi:uncharacterized protein simc1 [Brachionichthys hirsutus]|uniref:uncharacterized protein simc1 n=1 Tax=Brachionichthys hirsutus TaxID=412623 RepID=UPI0036049386
MDVISISSGSCSEESDVVMVGAYRNVLMKDDPGPLSAVRVDVNALNVNVPANYIDIVNSRRTIPEPTIGKRRNSTTFVVVDLTEDDTEKATKNELTQDARLLKKGLTDEINVLNKRNFYTNGGSSGDSPIFALELDVANIKPKHCVDSQTPPQQINDASITRQVLEISQIYNTEVKTAKCSTRLSTGCAETSVQPRLLNGNSEQSESICVSQTTSSNGPRVKPSLDESLPEEIESLTRLEPETCKRVQRQQSPANSSDKESSFAAFMEQTGSEDERETACLSVHISTAFPSLSHHSFRGEVSCSSPEELELMQEDYGQIHPSEKQSPHSLTAGLQPAELCDMDTLTYTSHDSEHSPPDNKSELQLKKYQRDEASCSLAGCRQRESSLSFDKTEDLSDGSWLGTLREDLGKDSPSFLWQEWSEGDQVNAESRFDMNSRVASSADRHFVCPVTLRKMMARSSQTPIYEDDEGFGMPTLLCRQSLNLVYSTIDEHYTEGTLQLLSDLLQPGYYPPKDITYHLLHDILLNPQCPYHLCLQAYNLLIRTQRHHMADRTSVPWNWDLLTLVINKQEHKQRLRCEIVRMLFEYVLRTLEEDFQAKCSTSAVHHSIAKATLSCNEQLCRVRDVINWLFSAIMKSTEHEKSKAERDEQIRMVSILQRMLLLALEVDRSPALNSAQLSQELFFQLIGKMHLRAHRMLLLESLQSKLVRCKLLELLLDYACPVKTCLPMSLGLVLHFMKYCTLASDPADGSERWQKWEELVHILWMILLSYNKAMKGCLYSSVSEQRSRAGNMVYKRDDMVTKPAVCEAVEAFLSRSREDLGQSLPLHVEESLTYLQDHLLDVCQC